MEVIDQVRRKGGCATVVFESGQSMRVPHALYMLNKLRPGQAIDPDKYEKWRAGVEFQLALERAVAYIQNVERASGQVKSTLKRNGYHDDVIDKVLLTLQENRYVSDTRFAGLWVDARANKLGRNRIRQELRMKGVDEETTRRALEAFTEDDELEMAVMQAKKLQRRYDDEKKLLNAMIRKGYSFSVAKRALKMAGEEIDIDEEE